jgi:ankyrin repeat protein
LPGNAEIVLHLTESHADANNTNYITGNTALIYAVMYNNVDIAKSLLDARADVNKTNADKYTPMDIACSFDSDEAIIGLLKSKAGLGRRRIRSGLRFRAITQGIENAVSKNK